MSAHPAPPPVAPSLRFGQVVIGPPGSGKTTYCRGMAEFLRLLGRKVAVVNLDPANEGLPYACAVDVSELVTLADVMDGLHLGPNGGLLYCMDYLEANLDWLQAKLQPHADTYFLFDCPGQVELYTHQNSVKSVFARLSQWNFRVRRWMTRFSSDIPQCTSPLLSISTGTCTLPRSTSTNNSWSLCPPFKRVCTFTHLYTHSDTFIRTHTRDCFCVLLQSPGVCLF